MERSEVQFGSTAIEYAVDRARRHKTVAIRVDPIEGVRVRAPQGLSVAALDEIVRRKAKWILDRRRRHEDLPPPPSARRFVSGETFLYLGRQYRLKVDRECTSDPSVRMVAGRLRISAPDCLRETEIRNELVGWYRDRAARRLPDRVAFWAARLDLEPNGVLIRDQRKRWGSADAKGNIRLNWRVVQARQSLADYVIAHELVHLIYPDHTRDFWATLGVVLPDYEARREALRLQGRLLVW